MTLDDEGQLLQRTEEVSIDAVSVGDYVGLAASSRTDRCVLVKAATRSRRGDHVTGWRIELTGGASAWLPRGAKLARRRWDASEKRRP